MRNATAFWQPSLRTRGLRLQPYKPLMRRRFVIAILVAGTLTLVGAASGPLMSQVEVPKYTVERAEGPIEVRTYPSMIVASVTLQDPRGSAISNGFKILAGYIFGGNDGSKKIEMTAPVMQQRAGERSAGQPNASGAWKISFVMPRGWTLETLPKAKDSRVELAAAPAATFAAIRFSGFARAAALKAKTDELMAFVERNKLQPHGAPIFCEDLPPAPRTDPAPPGPPPTIGHLRSSGMTHLTLTCATITCRRQKRLSFDDLRISDETLFPAIERCQKFVCAKCGSRKVEAFPDWSTVRAHGRP